MPVMRFRIPDVFDDHGVTVYAVAKQSKGRINYTTLYRLREKRGMVKNFDAALMSALCDVLDVTPGELLTRDDEPGYSPPVKPQSKRKKRDR